MVDAETPMRLTTLDLISVVMDGPPRRLDFAVVLHLRKGLDRSALESGALSARLQYPQTAAVLDGTTWHRTSTVESGIVFETTTDPHRSATEFLNTLWDLRRTPPVQQLVLSPADGSGATLVTRFHHAVCDGIGSLLWLRHQLEVANGLRSPLRSAERYETPVLLRPAKSVGRSAFAFRGPPDRLHASSRTPSGRRAWQTLSIGPDFRRAAAADAGDYSYNDLLAACALEICRRWNEGTSEHEPRVGLWLPVNIRAQSLTGFGNGTSRVRVYNRFLPGAGLREKSRSVRRQLDWSRENGEWSVPDLRTLASLPLQILAPALRLYFNRPWVDMGTATFSHIERSPLESPAFGDVARVELVGMLDKRHALGLFAVTNRETTTMSFVYDPSRLDETAVARLMTMYEEELSKVTPEPR